MSSLAVPVVFSVFAAQESLCGCCPGKGRLVGLFFSLEKAKAEMRCVCDCGGPRRRRRIGQLSKLTLLPVR